MNKSTPEQECLAIHFAINQFRPYVYGNQFLVRSDHKSLIYLFSHKNPSPKLTRIRVELEDYDFTIEHIKGKNNVAADALSRITIEDLKDLYGKAATVLPITRSMSRKLHKTVNSLPDQTTPIQIKEEDIPVVEDLSSSFSRTIPKIKCTRTKSTEDCVSRNSESFKIQAYMSHKQMFK